MEKFFRDHPIFKYISENCSLKSRSKKACRYGYPPEWDSEDDQFSIMEVQYSLNPINIVAFNYTIGTINIK